MEARWTPFFIDPICHGLQSAPEPSEDRILSFNGEESINISDWSETVDIELTYGETFYSEQQPHRLSRISRHWNDNIGPRGRPPTQEVSVLSFISPRDSVPSPEFHVCNYNLPCEFEFLGSQVHFHPDSYEEWTTHTAFHFKHSPLASPLSGLCFGQSLNSLHTLNDQTIESVDSTSHSPNRRPSLGEISPYLTNRSSGNFRQGGSYCPECRDFFKDLKAHLLVHKFKRHQKCPIQVCDREARSFARKYDVDRHLLNEHKRTTCLKSSEGCGKASDMSFSDAFDYSDQSFDVNLNKLISHCSRHEEKYRHSHRQKSILVKQKLIAEWDGRMICNVASRPVGVQFLEFFNITMGFCFSFLASTLSLWTGSSPWRAKWRIRVLADELHAVCRLIAVPL